MELGSAFPAKDREPGDGDLRLVLGGAYDAWHRLQALLAARLRNLEPVWGYAGVRYGWSLRVRQGKRILVYLTPQAGQFLVSFALGARAVAAAQATRLPAAMLRVIDAAPRYAEGRGVRFVTRSERQVAALVRLTEIKSRH